MKYKNIVSNKPNFQGSVTLSEYDNKSDAIKNFEQDIEKFENEYKHTIEYKLNFPYYFATIGMEGEN